MSESLSSSLLEKYIDSYDAVQRCKQSHVFVGAVALTVGIVIGFIAYAALTSGWLPPMGLGPHGNVAAAVVAGSFVTSTGLIGVLIHFAFKYAETLRISSEEAFLSALQDEATDNIFKRKNSDGASSLAQVHFL